MSSCPEQQLAAVQSSPRGLHAVQVQVSSTSSISPTNVVVPEHPFCSLSQHHAFLSSDQPACQFEYPASQSYGLDVPASGSPTGSGPSVAGGASLGVSTTTGASSPASAPASG